jgi:hypothetical protein
MNGQLSDRPADGAASSAGAVRMPGTGAADDEG